MKKSNLGFIFLGVLIGVIGFYMYTEWYGNPIAMPSIRGHMIDYVQLKYPQLEHKNGNITFHTKDDSYRMKVDVKDSEDEDFYVVYLHDEMSDDREERVENKGNLAERFQMYLNREELSEIIKNKFKENLNFVHFSYEESYWKNNLPELDTPVEQFISIYPLTCSIHLEKELKASYDEIQQLKNELILAYQEQGIHITELTIDNQ